MKDSEPKFEEWYKDEWIEHIRDAGSIKGQLKLLIGMVSVLVTSNIVLVGFLLTKNTL